MAMLNNQMVVEASRHSGCSGHWLTAFAATRSGLVGGLRQVMATTTNGFAKVHVASDNGGVDKAWLESLDDGYNTLRRSFKSQTSWSSLAFNEWGEQKGTKLPSLISTSNSIHHWPQVAGLDLFCKLMVLMVRIFENLQVEIFIPGGHGFPKFE